MAQAEYENKSANEIIQALDALSRTLSLARASRRTSPRSARSLSRSASSSGGDAGDAVAPRALFLSGSTRDRAAVVDAAAAGEVAASPRPRVRRLSSAPTTPFPANKPPTPDKVGDGQEYDDSADSAQLKSQGFTAVTPADVQEEETKASVGMRRMGCLCSVEVVAAQGLPPSTDGLRLTVTVRKKETRDGAAQTMTARVRLGAAAFDEALYVRCHLYGGLEPRPFLLSLVVDGPELDMGRSTVDLSLFAKEFTEKCQQGESFQQWDVAVPLAGKAQGGELVIKLAFQSIVDESGPRTTRTTRALKVDVPAPDLISVDSFKLDDLEAEPNPIEEVKEMQKEEPESTTADEPVVKVKEREKEPEPVDELTPVADMKEEQQTEPDEAVDELTAVTDVKEEQLKELEAVDELTPPVANVMEEQQKEPEPSDEPIPATDLKEEAEQHKELEPVDEPTPVPEVKEEEEQQKEPQCEPTNEPTVVTELKATEQQNDEPECEPANEPTLVAEVTKEEQKQKEPENKPADDELTPVVEAVEERRKEPEDMQENDNSELLEFDVIAKELDGQQVKVELKEEDQINKESEEEASVVAADEVAKVVANGLEENSFESTMPSVDADVVEPVGAEEVTEESSQVPKRGGKGASVKPSRPPLKWRTVAILVPVSLLFSKTLGAN